jgi:hypothetical protein
VIQLLKKGDRVTIRQDLQIGHTKFGRNITSEMVKYAGQRHKILLVREDRDGKPFYEFEGIGGWFWDEYMFEWNGPIEVEIVEK